jgi:formate dehydrogenase (NADP+) beta subunit
MADYRTFLPDLEYYQKNIACQFACPVRTDGRAYVNAIARGEYERAYLIARETNPFASTCGWVCGAPCEAACRRGTIDEPVAIRALKRFVNDKYGVYLGESGEEHQPPAWRGYVGRTDRYDLGNTTFPTSRSGLHKIQSQTQATGKRVAIVGAGPAGLSCAHDLALMGHAVKIFESASAAGGMLRLGVPEYRLPRELIDLEIEAILRLGPTIEFNQALGRDFSLADLHQDFDAIFLAFGTYQGRNLNIEGEQLDGVLRAVDFLINVNLGGYNLDLGKRVVVIGGGNVAMDVARTAARVGHPAQSGGDLEVALDAARTAARLGATQEVICLVVEARDEMLADALEIFEASNEGVRIENNISPKRILGDGHARALETISVASAFDEQGRFNPQLISGSEKIWECDSVIVAIGQSGEFGWVNEEDQIEVSARGTLVIDPETLMTTAAGVFAGGDIAFGPRMIVNAVADGQRGARGIHSFLQSLRPRTIKKGFFTPISTKAYPKLGPFDKYMQPAREEPLLLPVDRRIGVSHVEIGYEEKTARTQGERCLICSINPVFDGELCILCNGCVDVCPQDCLKLVPISSLDGDVATTTLISLQMKEWDTGSAMLFDPTSCIRCGLCAQRCPTEAVRMESFRFVEENVFEPIENL